MHWQEHSCPHQSGQLGGLPIVHVAGDVLLLPEVVAPVDGQTYNVRLVFFQTLYQTIIDDGIAAVVKRYPIQVNHKAQISRVPPRIWVEAIMRRRDGRDSEAASKIERPAHGRHFYS